MIDSEVHYTGKVDPDYKKRELLRILVRCFSTMLPISLIFILQIGLSIFYFSSLIINFIIISILIIAIIIVIIIIIANVYYNQYLKNFKFYITDNDVIINHGVFRQCRASIPYCRVQNISINSTIFERRYKLYSINIETAGTSSYPFRRRRRRYMRGEGYIVGQKDPTQIEKLLKDKINVCLRFMERRDEGYI